jgi:hypothetical protein
MESRRFFDLFGPPIAFRREFVPLTGSITAALLLSQMVFWTQQFCGPDGAGNEGWFFLPSQEDVQQQTCLTRHQLEAARGQLIKRGLIDESRKKLAGHESKKNGVVRYRINQDKVFELLGLPKTAILAKSSKLLGMPKTGSSECRKPEVRNAGNRKFLLEREKELKEKEPSPVAPRGGDSRRLTRRQRQASVGQWDGTPTPRHFPDDPRAQELNDRLASGGMLELAESVYLHQAQAQARPQ